MDDTKIFSSITVGAFPIVLFLIIFLALISNHSAGGKDAIAVVIIDDFSIPFESSTNFSVTSPFGFRDDPLGSGETKFHEGIDLATSCGTDIVASSSGVVQKVGYSETGFGNYVYIKHQTNNAILYSAYGHMLDDSIVVKEGDDIEKGQKIGQVGSTGASTGCHLHFQIMKNKISFKQEDLIDPYFIIYGLY